MERVGDNPRVSLYTQAAERCPTIRYVSFSRPVSVDSVLLRYGTEDFQFVTSVSEEPAVTAFTVRKYDVRSQEMIYVTSNKHSKH